MSSPVVAQTGRLNIYSARHYDTDQALWDGFTAHTGIRVNVIQGDADQLIERIRAEGRNSPADVLITVDAGRLWRAQQAELFQRVASPLLNQRVPASLRDPEGYWFGFSKRVRVIAYARDRVRPADLSTYEDLAHPRWRGKLLVRSSSHVYNQSLVGAMIERIGAQATEQWVRGLVANFARPPQGGDTDQIKGIAAGEGDVAIVNHYYYVRLVNSHSASDRAVAQKVGIFFPNQGPGERGVHVNISGAGVVATAPNRQAAVTFLEYLASERAQAIFARGNYEYPILDGVPSPVAGLGLGAFLEDSLNARAYAANSARALQIMIAAGWR
ncbi:MAG: Fe(3+) ABC transporter substrate-binding protein [Armatimonadota bacterium]|nr:Fe(3+) ABC transporter substrate-binding protein [Armatimonadota bacterium]MDR5696979.1 Fe(3+) ABC transporter substrate-binding protein [Armatimonadota bacterium]